MFSFRERISRDSVFLYPNSNGTVSAIVPLEPQGICVGNSTKIVVMSLNGRVQIPSLSAFGYWRNVV